MIKIYTDFNERSTDGLCWILLYGGVNGVSLDSAMKNINLSIGDNVILYQDGDFEVIAKLEFRFVDVIGRDALVAIPDFSTIINI